MVVMEELGCSIFNKEKKERKKERKKESSRKRKSVLVLSAK